MARPSRRDLLATALAGLGGLPLAARAASYRGMRHVILLGDSVFDNAAYVGGGLDVLRQVRDLLPPADRADLLARDGAVTADVSRQVQAIPAGATHLVVSAGGNDALRVSGVLEESSRSVAETLMRLADLQQVFERDYRAMLDRVTAPGLPVAVCTIYDPRFPDPVQRRIGRAGLAFFNDSILRAAALRGLSVLDLRLLCSEDADFANPIEPSSRGGAKIAAAIERWSAAPADGTARILAR